MRYSWVNTCVNYRNYKFFIQFLGYALAFCLWGFFTDMQYFISFWQVRALFWDCLCNLQYLYPSIFLNVHLICSDYFIQTFRVLCQMTCHILIHFQGDLSTKQPGRFHILFMFFVTGMFAISVSCLFFYHLYLTAKNQSTIGILNQI